MATNKSKSNTSLIPWDAKFEQYAKQGTEQVKNIGTAGISIKFGRGTISVGDAPVKGPFECIILGAVALNAWYASDYDPTEKLPPTCYAYSEIADDPEMAPHAAVLDKQAALCSECEKNQFGTAKVGRGKACNNTMRLGLILAKDAEDGEAVSTAELAMAKISPTNLKHYKEYVEAIQDEHARPLWAVVTEIRTYDDPKTQIRVEFKLVELIEDDSVLAALEKRFLKVQAALQQPFAAPAERKAQKPKAGASKKFAAKKAVKR